MMKRRGRLQMKIDTLSAINGGAMRMSHIYYKTGTSHVLQKEILEDLWSRGLVVSVKKKKVTRYSLTPLGVEYLRKGNSIVEKMMK